MILSVEVPDDHPDGEECVRALEAMLQAGSRVVLLRRPLGVPDEIWPVISPTLVARAVAALHGQEVGALVLG